MVSRRTEMLEGKQFYRSVLVLGHVFIMSRGYVDICSSSRILTLNRTQIMVVQSRRMLDYSRPCLLPITTDSHNVYLGTSTCFTSSPLQGRTVYWV